MHLLSNFLFSENVVLIFSSDLYWKKAKGQFYPINSHINTYIFIDSVEKIGKIVFRNSRHSPYFPAIFLFVKALHIQLSSLYLIDCLQLLWSWGNPLFQNLKHSNRQKLFLNTYTLLSLSKLSWDAIGYTRRVSSV